MSEDSVGAVVKKLRLHRGESLRSLAERAGFSAMQLHRIEEGESQPSEGKIRSLAQALEVPVSVLFGETPSPADTAELVRDTVAETLKQLNSDEFTQRVAKEILRQLVKRIS